MTNVLDIDIRPLTPVDHEVVIGWASTPGIGERWRYAHGVPSAEDLEISIWDGVLEQCLIFSVSDQAPVGLVSAYNPDARNGTCYLAVVEDPARIGSGLAMVGVALFINRLFSERDLRLVRIEAYDYSFDQFKSIAEKVARLDGVLRDDDLALDGVLHDKYLLSITRDAWTATYGPKVGTFRQRAERWRASGPTGAQPPA